MVIFFLNRKLKTIIQRYKKGTRSYQNKVSGGGKKKKNK